VLHLEVSIGSLFTPLKVPLSITPHQLLSPDHPAGQCLPDELELLHTRQLTQEQLGQSILRCKVFLSELLPRLLLN
jgi:hypothetical protein